MFDFQAYVNKHKSSKNNHTIPSHYDLMQWILESLDNSKIMDAKSTLPDTIIEYLYNDIRQRLKQQLKDNQFKQQTLIYYPETFFNDFHEFFYSNNQIKDASPRKTYDLVNNKINEHIDNLNVKDKQLAKRKYLNKFFCDAEKRTGISNLLIGLGRIEKLDVSLEKDKQDIYYLKFIKKKKKKENIK